MPRPVNHAVETSGTITNVFAGLMGEDSPFVTHNRKLDDMRVDGVRIGDRRAALLRAGEPRVTEAHQSSVMAADILMSLGFDSGSAEIVRRAADKPPDLELLFRVGPVRTVYAEFSRVCYRVDESMQSLTWELDSALAEVAKHDAALAAVLATRSVHITFGSRPVTRPTMRQLLDEIKRFIVSYDAQTRELAPYPAFDGTYPALQSVSATYWWSSSGWIGGSIVMYNAADLGLAALIAAIKARIAAKAGKKYQQRPLWLLLSVSETWRKSVGELFAGMRDGSLVFHAPDFDRLVTGVTGEAVAVPPILPPTGGGAPARPSSAPTQR
jgi:hypothetical protein